MLVFFLKKNPQTSQMATKVNNKPKKNTSQQRSNNERGGQNNSNGGLTYLRFVDALFFFMLAFSVESYSGDYFSTGKSCAYDRLKHGDYWHKSTSGLLLNFSVSVLVVLWVLVTSWPRTKHENWSLNWSSIYNVGFLLTWFYGTFCLCVLGKFLLRDDTCSLPGRFNSVSGHFNFHIYYLLSVAYAATKIRPQKHPLITDVFSPDMLFNFTKLRLYGEAHPFSFSSLDLRLT
jgi:hypothetical protein